MAGQKVNVGSSFGYDLRKSPTICPKCKHRVRIPAGMEICIACDVRNGMPLIVNGRRREN